ncbi:hypothetical protein HDU98_004795 [Podochytrium sp. JEL0797]|nr:hypothetical protein HDU98_004795 [Podochytrium sp. JEL0797]
MIASLGTSTNKRTRCTSDSDSSDESADESKAKQPRTAAITPPPSDSNHHHHNYVSVNALLHSAQMLEQEKLKALRKPALPPLEAVPRGEQVDYSKMNSLLYQLSKERGRVRDEHEDYDPANTQQKSSQQ